MRLPAWFVNGSEVDPRSASALSLAACDVNVFETMRIEGGKIFRLREHLERLSDSARTVGFGIVKRLSKIEAGLVKVLSSRELPPRVFLRLTLTKQDDIVFLFHRAYPASVYEQGIDMITAATRRNLSHSFVPEAKTNQFLNGVMAKLDAALRGPAFEVLYLDGDGYAKETLVWNLFIVKKSALQTPPPDGILNGVTRRFVIECAFKEKISVLEAPMTRHDIWNAAEAFLTNTSGGIVPVRLLDGRLISNGLPGEITQRLMKRFQAEMKKELENASY